MNVVRELGRGDSLNPTDTLVLDLMGEEEAEIDTGSRKRDAREVAGDPKRQHSLEGDYLVRADASESGLKGGEGGPNYRGSTLEMVLERSEIARVLPGAPLEPPAALRAGPTTRGDAWAAH
jgi:hypothetical protein